jgi:3-oxoadipate enol-lactonase
MPFTHVSDITIYYEVLGENGSPIVFISGYSCSKVDWDLSHLQRIANRHRVVIFDNRGTGQTDKPSTPYTMLGFAADTIGILDALAIDSAYILGVSMGGMIAQHVALEYPERVLGLILGCTAAGEHGNLYPYSPSNEVLEILTRPSSGDRAKDIRDAWPIIYSREFIEGNRAYLEARLQDSLNYPEAPPYALQLQLEAILTTHDTLPRLSDIHHPTLVQTGSLDVLIPPGNSRFLADHIPNAHFIEYPGAGHGYLDEVSDAAVNDILSFLDVNDSRTPGGEP